MITADITLVSNRASQTLPGTATSLTYNQVATIEPGTVLRRAPTSAETTPQEFKIQHTQTGGAGFSRRNRSVIRFTYSDLTADPTETGNVVPSFSWTLTLDRPANSGGAITAVLLSNALGQMMDLLLQSGNLTKFYNLEG